MATNEAIACTCWQRYRVCVVPLASVLAIVALGWMAGRWLFPRGDAGALRSITILDIPGASIPDSAELRGLPSRRETLDSSAAVGKALKYSALVKWSAAMFFNLMLFVCALAIAGHILLPALREGLRDNCRLSRQGRAWAISVVLVVLVVTYLLARLQADKAPFTGLSRVLLMQTVGSRALVDIVTQWDSIGICVIVMIAMAAGATLNTTGCGIIGTKPAGGGAVNAGPGDRKDAPGIAAMRRRIWMVVRGIVRLRPAGDGTPAEGDVSDDEKARKNLAQKQEIRMLARQTHRLRLLLYVGAIVLVFSLFETSSLFRLASVFTDPGVALKPASPGSLASGVDSIVSSLTMFRGFLYVLFLVGLYVPAAAIIRTRSVEVARTAIVDDKETMSEQWLADHGLTLTPTELLKPLLAIVSPLLAVPFGELIGRL